jgi:ABC-type cobalamin/Fe3+-siderophores transport system ATPase subunit
MLSAVNKCRFFAGKTLILSVDELHLMSGECLIIKGKNGSGKSTLLKIMIF